MNMKSTSRPIATRGINQSMEVFKLLASFLVVFAHCSFPGHVGSVMHPIIRVSVPGFFAISGFFSYQVGWKKLNKRIRHILLLTGGAIAAELIAGCISVEIFGLYPEDFSGSVVAYLRSMIPTAQEWAYWIVCHLSPIREPHWYLTAVLFCYCVLWVYTRFFGDERISYSPFYLICFVLYLFNLTGGTMTQIMSSDGTGTIFLRTGLYFGLPMFGLGMFLSQYRDQIWNNFALSASKLILLSIFGICFSIYERFYIGFSDLYLGGVVAVIALMLLMQRYPRITENKLLCRMIDHFGFLSTGIYILHSVMIDIELNFLEIPLSQSIPNFPWLRPWLVLGMSIAASILWEILWTFWKKVWRKIKR